MNKGGAHVEMQSQSSAALDLEMVVAQHGDRLLRLCFLYLRDVYAAQDALQETLLRAWRASESFRGEAEASTWLTRIAINVCKTMLRRQLWWRMHEPVALEGIPGPETPAEDSALLCAVLSLPDKYREVVLLHYYQELRLREIAAALRLPQGTVAVRLKRARDLLRAMGEGGAFDAE